MQITFDNTKYRYKDNQWEFLAEKGELLPTDCWFPVTIKDRIIELDNFVREQKLERICK